MNWEVLLAGDRIDLEDLTLSFTGSDWTVTKSKDRYILTSPEFEALNNSENIRSLAERFLERINGAAKLVLDSATPISIEAIQGPNPDSSGKRMSFMPPIHIGIRGVMRVSLSFVQPDGTVVTHHPADEIRSWIRLAKNDDSVAKALDLLNGKWDWVNLYRIFEIVEHDCGGLDGVGKKGWTTKAELRLFKHTANHPAATGLDARHGFMSQQPPPTPMTLPDAQTLIMRLVESWLRSK